ncbi:Haloacid dehalogenase-like hydrolase domain-containing protein [Dinothrombium tinctorium]|uniref:Haloacid dehalogenase-like hydrolase domain-containing protein n=1 Tax=Dinothrombium tinctorium TaxID=1965070 RepID=A0A3S3Q1K6_9ACAR|nr:Haloacid dehalogenase-like hydrolase domain-containing protein [Dinothrombium tinctorium]RWS12180.1 Haloacid dehalogenase-like hydrolase domain-containing protein [Dinothrombium tinctorium]
MGSTSSARVYGNISHVLFDFDGTLIDTLSCYHKSLNRVIAEFNKTVPQNMMPEILEKATVLEAVDLIIRKLHLPLTAENYAQSYEKDLKETMKDVELMPGAFDIIKYFHERRIPIGLCTQVSSKFFEFESRKFKDLFEVGKHFELIVTAENDPEIKRNKPHPDPYIVTINRFKTRPKPENVLVFEDSIQGVESAINAGAKCVMVQDKRIFNEASALATLVIQSFKEFNPDLFNWLPS